MHHESNDHGVAGTIGLTGSIAGAVGLGGPDNTKASRPSTGAIVGRLRNGSAGSLPPYIILGNPLHQGLKRAVGEGSGAMGSTYEPFRLDYEPGVGLKLPDASLPDGVNASRLHARWDLLQQLGGPKSGPSADRALFPHDQRSTNSLTPSSPRVKVWPRSTSAARPHQARDAYGRHRFGQCCLIACRLVESGIPFVQVNWSTHVEGPEDAGDGGWDMHDRYFQIMQDRHGWMLDQALSALLDDLHDRGLLDSTLVVAAGRIRPNSQDQRPSRPRPLEYLLFGARGRRRRARRAGRRGVRPSGRTSSRPTGDSGGPGRDHPVAAGHRHDRPDRNRPDAGGRSHHGTVLTEDERTRWARAYFRSGSPARRWPSVRRPIRPHARARPRSRTLDFRRAG